MAALLCWTAASSRLLVPHPWGAVTALLGFGSGLSSHSRFPLRAPLAVGVQGEVGGGHGPPTAAVLPAVQLSPLSPFCWQ